VPLPLFDLPAHSRRRLRQLRPGPAAGVRHRAGADRLTRYDSSPGCRRYFCARCGAHLYSDVDSLPEVRFYTIGTLDGGVHPGHAREKERHIHVGSKMPWWHITDDLRQDDE